MSQGLNKISTFVLGCFAEPSAARGSQEQAAEAKRSLEQPGAAIKFRLLCRGASQNQKLPGAARSKQQKPTGDRSSSEQPGADRSSQE